MHRLDGQQNYCSWRFYSDKRCGIPSVGVVLLLALGGMAAPNRQLARRSADDTSGCKPSALSPDFRLNLGDVSRVRVKALHFSERYGNIFECGSKTYMLTRKDLPFVSKAGLPAQWATNIRIMSRHSSYLRALPSSKLGESTGKEKPLLDFSEPYSPRELHPYAHNLAGHCSSNRSQIFVYGGQDRLGLERQSAAFSRGIARVVATADQNISRPSIIHWSPEKSKTRSWC